MCLLDFWSRINELFLFLSDKSDALRLDEKQHMAALNNERVVQYKSIIFLFAVLT